MIQTDQSSLKWLACRFFYSGILLQDTSTYKVFISVRYSVVGCGTVHISKHLLLSSCVNIKMFFLICKILRKKNTSISYTVKKNIYIYKIGDRFRYIFFSSAKDRFQIKCIKENLFGTLGFAI